MKLTASSNNSRPNHHEWYTTARAAVGLIRASVSVGGRHGRAGCQRQQDGCRFPAGKKAFDFVTETHASWNRVFCKDTRSRAESESSPRNSDRMGGYGFCRERFTARIFFRLPASLRHRISVRCAMVAESPPFRPASCPVRRLRSLGYHGWEKTRHDRPLYSVRGMPER